MKSGAGRPMAVSATALMVGCLAFWLYRATMLPGLDLGDTPSFQTMGGKALISARDAYPLYFALASPFVWWFPDNPAHAMNLTSVVEASAALALMFFVAFEVSGSLGAAVVATVIFGSSYTFWSQAIITEVYALHMAFVAGVLLALWGWEREPSPGRLVCFFLVYAFGFANHLSMIVLMPGLVAFLFVAAPGGPRSLFRPGIITAAILCAIAGALPYLWTIRTMLADAAVPQGVPETARWFWFDVTKADWRETMVLQVPRVMTTERLRMFVFDVIQQFGVAWLLIAAAGSVVLARTQPARLALLALWMMATALFALTYSVGDTHVFLLPLHFAVAVLIAPGVLTLSALARRFGALGPGLVLVVALLAAASRTYSEYPALDRSNDHRPEQALDELTNGVDDRHAILLAELDWQLQNGLNYYAEHSRPDVAFARMSEVLPYAPVLIRDNRAIGRDTVVTDIARAELMAAYGPLFRAVPAVAPAGVFARISEIRPGSRYVLCWLKPIPEVTFDKSEVDRAAGFLTGGQVPKLPEGDFVMIAGRVGEPPVAVRGSVTPFHQDFSLEGLPILVRMDAWFPFDTIRRMGFGHVIAQRNHSLILERGLSFVALDDEGRAAKTVYGAGFYEPQATFRVLDATSP